MSEISKPVPLKSSLRNKSDSDLMKGVPDSDTSMTTASLTTYEGSGDDSINSGAPPAVPSPQSLAAMKKTVSFGNLEALTFPVVKGDPNFEMAYPMTLGWDLWHEETHDIEEYEAVRGPRRNQYELRTMTEDRKQILKASKKQGKHRRRESIANGQIGKDARRNLVQEFLIASANALTGNTKAPEKTDESPSLPKRGIRRQNSIGNGEISRLSDTVKLPKSGDEDAPPSPRRGGLRRQNSIGNGEISRHKKRNSVQRFLKTMGSFGSSKKAEPVYNNPAVVVEEPSWPPKKESSASAELQTEAPPASKPVVEPKMEKYEVDC